MKIQLLYFIIILTCSSCATLLNKKNTQLEIITNSPATVVLGKDTLKNINNITYLDVLRQEKPLSIAVFNDSIVKKVTIDSKNSFAYWANLGFYSGLGMLVDRNNPKRYTYPKTVYLDMENGDNSYTTLSNKGIKNKLILKITPLKLIGANNPGLELSAEKGMGNRFTSQIMASYLLPVRFTDIGNDFQPNIKGYRLAIEERMYLKKFAPVGSYLGFEFNYMKNKFQDIVEYSSYSGYFFPMSHKTYSDSLGITKQTYSFTLKFGHQFFVKKGISLDLFTGFGLRYKDVRHFNLSHPKEEIFMSNDPDILYIGNKRGKYWTINVPLSLRIGWVI